MKESLKKSKISPKNKRTLSKRVKIPLTTNRNKNTSKRKKDTVQKK